MVCISPAYLALDVGGPQGGALGSCLYGTAKGSIRSDYRLGSEHCGEDLGFMEEFRLHMSIAFAFINSLRLQSTKAGGLQLGLKNFASSLRRHAIAFSLQARSRYNVGLPLVSCCGELPGKVPRGTWSLACPGESSAERRAHWPVAFDR